MGQKVTETAISGQNPIKAQPDIPKIINKMKPSILHQKQDELMRAPSFAKNLNILLHLMECLSIDVNDREICRRLRIFIQTVPIDLDEDTSRELRTYRRILNDSKLPESVMPFYRHYQFMFKRAESAEKKHA